MHVKQIVANILWARYGELYEEDEGIMLKMEKRSPPPYA